jgi:hypothetical protein
MRGDVAAAVTTGTFPRGAAAVEEAPPTDSGDGGCGGSEHAASSG